MKKWFFLLLLISNHAVAEWWTDDSTTNGLMIAMNTAILVDWGQTNNGADRYDGTQGRDKLFETNPALDRYPDDEEVNKVMIANLAIYNAIGYFLPKNLKKSFYAGAFLYRYNAISNNHELGLSVNF